MVDIDGAVRRNAFQTFIRHVPHDLFNLVPDRDAPGRLPVIWAKIQKIMRDVPDEALASIPTDGSINVDHYLYGASVR